MADLTRAEATLSQRGWAIISAALDEDAAAATYLLGTLERDELAVIAYGLAVMAALALTNGHGADEARQLATAQTVQHAATAEAAGE